MEYYLYVKDGEGNEQKLPCTTLLECKKEYARLLKKGVKTINIKTNIFGEDAVTMGSIKDKPKTSHYNKEGQGNTIRSFTGYYKFLDLGYETPIRLMDKDGNTVTFKSAKVVYYAFKTNAIDMNTCIVIDDSFNKLKGGAAEKLAYKRKTIPNWEQYKYTVLYYVNTLKFNSNLVLQKALIDTKNKKIKPTSVTGKVLMAIRNNYTMYNRQ